jgi:hypothetical protein
VGFFQGDFLTLKPKVGEILNFESFLSWNINLKLKFKISELGSIIRVLFTLEKIIIVFTLGPMAHAKLVYLLRKLICLSCADLLSCSALNYILGTSEKILMRRGAPRWFCNVWTFGASAIEYLTILSMRIEKFKTNCLREIWAYFWYCWNILNDYEGISEFIDLSSSRLNFE